jgi:hypothetical protein
MSRILFRMVSAAAVLCVLSATQACADAAPAGHLLGVDDMLAMEHIGRVDVADGGHLVLFEKGGPNEGFKDYGLDDQVASSRIYVFDRSKTAAPRRLLPNFEFANWIGAVSPDGKRLALYWRDHDLVKAGSVDLATGKLTAFPFNPTFDFQQSQPLWVTNDTLVYSTDPQDHPSPRVDFRRQSALMESTLQQRAWHGQVSSTVIESHGTDFTPDWRPGTIVRVEAKSGKTTVLAQGKYVELALSPDHRYLAAARQGRYLRFRPDSGKEVYDAHRLEPRLIDLENPQAAPVPMCDGCQLSGLSEFTWGPSGHRVSYFARFGNEAWERSRFRIFDADTRSLTEVRHVGLDLASQYEAGMTQSSPVKAIPFADGALVAARRQSDPKADPIFTYKEPVRNRIYGMVSENAAKLGRLDWYFVAPDGSSRAVTGALKDVDLVTAASDPHGLYFLGDNKVQRVELDGSVKDAAVFAGAGMFYNLDGSIDGGAHAIAITAGSAGMAVEYFSGTARSNSVSVPPTIGRPLVADAKSGVVAFLAAGAGGSTLTAVDREGHIQPIISINQHLKQVIPAKQVVLKYTMPNGEQVSSCLLLPGNAVPGKPLPMIVWTYPGGQGGCGMPTWQYGLADTYGQEILTGYGYAVLRPFAPARLLTDGHNPVANWGAVVQPAVDEAVKEGYADKDRLGAWGMSLGGHAVLSLLSQTHIFKAGIALNGVADFFSNYASLGLVRSMMSDDLFAVGHATLYESAPDEGAYMGAPPWDKPNEYAAASPLSNAGKMDTPLMLFAGDLDWDYQMTEFDQYFTALLRQGKEAVYVRYWGEGHGNMSPANVRDAWQRMHAWYDSHLH